MELKEIEIKSEDVLKFDFWKENYYSMFLNIIMTEKSVYDARDQIYNLCYELEEVYRYLYYNKYDIKANQVKELIDLFRSDWFLMWTVIDKGRNEKSSAENSVYKELRATIKK